MVTRVGYQTSFIEAIKELIELDYDAVEAYEAAINRLEHSDYKNKLKTFKEDHQRHIQELSEFLARCGEEAPEASDNTKGLLAQGKVVLSSILGDSNILKAMLSNERDTNEAYERINSRVTKALDPTLVRVLAKGLEDEKKHKEWLKSVTSD